MEAAAAVEAAVAAGSRGYVDFDDFAIAANNRLASVKRLFGFG